MIQHFSTLKAADDTQNAEELIQKLESPAAEAPEKKEFEISPSKEKDAIHALEKFNKFLTKQGLPLIQYSLDPELKQREVVETNQNEESPDYGKQTKYLVYFKLLTIEANPLKDLEWEIAGTKEPVAASGLGGNKEGNLVFLQNKYYKGPAVPETMQTRLMQCDYCKSGHERTKTIILHNKKTGEMIEAGRSCLKFYVGNLNIEKFNHNLSSLFGEMEEFGASSSKIRAVNLKEVVATSIFVIDRAGKYISKAVAEQTNQHSTASTVEFYLFSSASNFGPAASQDFIEDKKAIGELFPRADEVIKWFREESPKMEKNDFTDKLRIICEHDIINPKLIGFAAYLYQLYKNKMGEGKPGGPKTPQKPSEYVGNPGDKMEKQLFVVKAVGFDSQWGYISIYLMKDKEGNMFKWKTSSGGLNEKHTYTLRFTIKGHEEYKGTKQTEITRAKVLSEKDPNVFSPQFD